MMNFLVLWIILLCLLGQLSDVLPSEQKIEVSPVPPVSLSAIIGRLPTVSDSRRSNFDGRIWLTWPYSSDQFDFINYKALESLLVLYPHAHFLIFILAPNSADYYKVGKILSKTTFQKYTKKALKISFQVIHHSTDIYKPDLYHPGAKSSDRSALLSSTDEILQKTVENYWKPRITEHCEVKTHINFLRDKSSAPYHLQLYFAMFQLYQRGGIFTDFTFLHQFSIFHLLRARLEGPGDGNTVQYEGYKIKSVCLFSDQSGASSSSKRKKAKRGPKRSQKFVRNSPDDPFQSPMDSESSSPTANEDAMVCRTSTLLAFSAGHPVLSCVLAHYDQPIFLDCLQRRQSVDSKGSVGDGVFCIENALKDCFRKFSLENPLADEFSLHQTYERARTLPPPLSKNPVVAVKKDYYLQLIQSSCYYVSNVLKNDISVHLMINPDAHEEQVEQCHSYPFVYHQLLFSETTASSFQESAKPLFPFIWLGLPAFSGDWLIPSESSFLGRWFRHNEQRLAAIPSDSNFTVPPSTCPHYLTTETDPLTVQRRANLSCSLSFVIPGFMKAGTTFFYDLVIQHPVVVKALQGVNFKETGCYLDINPTNYRPPLSYSAPQSVLPVLPNRKTALLNCFPFIEASDGLLYGDATVYYGTRQIVPYYLHQDNPSMKIVFSLRNPIDRTLSHHRFTYRHLDNRQKGNINECLLFVLNDEQQILWKWHHQANEILTTDDPFLREKLIENLMESYFQGLGRKKNTKDNIYNRCGHLILYSLYFMPIYHWHRIFPRENIRMVDISFLQPLSLSEEIKREMISKPSVIDQMDWDHLFRDKPLTILPVQEKGERLPSKEEQKKKEFTELDHEYLLHQMNGVYRFLGAPTLKRKFSGIYGHESRQEVPEEHQLNETMKTLLLRYYQPFNQLLREFMEGKYSLPR